ncbi:hypothetical protein EG328_008592 [Venturia inaequalis]|uniref:Uncharacterized protein n=1 Tax=Venturia inaequalis TaxID=5025 RepID=A0A8H3UBY7_VENIN|nr:hypothetical protein EG328_008592 [Venturia inaequalis]
MCFREIQVNAGCAMPQYHNHMQPRMIFAAEFGHYPFYKHYQYFPGFVPCKEVLEGQINAQDCMARGFVRREAQEVCASCNNIMEHSGHRVVFQEGVMVEATWLETGPHRYELLLVGKCGLCAAELRQREARKNMPPPAWGGDQSGGQAGDKSGGCGGKGKGRADEESREAWRYQTW